MFDIGRSILCPNIECIKINHGAMARKGKPCTSCGTHLIAVSFNEAIKINRKKDQYKKINSNKRRLFEKNTKYLMDIDKINKLVREGDFRTLYNNNAEFFYDVQILNPKTNFLSSQKNYQNSRKWDKAHIRFFKDKFIIYKKGFWTGFDKGSQIIHYDKVGSINIEKGFLNTTITIGLNSTELITLKNRGNSVDTVKRVFENYLELWYETSSLNNNDITNSMADEITKFHDLKEKGIITEKEFRIKKKKLLGS